MIIEQLLDTMQQRKIRLSLAGENLKVVDPDKQLNPQIIAALKQHKPQLLKMLSEGRGFTQSDFPYARLAEGQIGELQRQYPDLENLYLATPMQKGMLYHGMLDGSGASYTTQFFADLVGELDYQAFERAWQTMVDRHCVYRTCFVGFEQQDIHQLVNKQAKLDIQYHDWREKLAGADSIHQALGEFRLADKAAGFDFGRPPLMRVHLIQLEDQKHHFIWSQHHALSDGWCGPLVFSEVIQVYNAGCQGKTVSLPPVVPYHNYIAWFLQQDQQQAGMFWKDHLAGFSQPTDIMVDRFPTAANASTEVKKLHLHLTEQESDNLSSLAKHHACTVNVVLQAAWAYLLYRYSGEHDVLFGGTVSGRPAGLPGMDKMVGLFINSLPVRVRLNSQTPLSELLNSIHNDNLARDEFNFLALTEMHRLSAVPNDQPLFRSLLVFENYPVQMDLGDVPQGASQQLKMEQVAADEQTNFAITLGASLARQLKIKIGYRPNLIADHAMLRLFRHLQQILQYMAGLVEKPSKDTLMGQIHYLADDERDLLYKLASSGGELSVPEKPSLIQQLAEQVKRKGNETALVCRNEQISYSTLFEKAQRYARYLRQQGVKADECVALCTERKTDLFVGMIAILLAGAAYVPIEPRQPSARKRYMLQDANVRFVLTQSEFSADVGELDISELPIEAVLLDQPLPQTPMESALVPETDVLPDSGKSDLAYVIYTSGSTGQPKGVLVEHGNVLNYQQVFLQHLHSLSVNDDSAWLWNASFAFDASIKGLLALCQGKTVVMADDEQMKDPQQLLQLMKDWHIEVFNGVPSIAEVLLGLIECDPELTGKISFIIGGEAIPDRLKQQLVDYYQRTGCAAINAYGPTELTVNATSSVIGPQGYQDIGLPVINSQAYVMADDMTLAPFGADGELVMGGELMARGYLDKPEQTARQFIDSPPACAVACRLYRTGDKVHWLTPQIEKEAYHLVYKGRIDKQVKVRGYRIELEEIEAQILRSEEVLECRVLVSEAQQAQQDLLAFIVPKHAKLLHSDVQAEWLSLCRQRLQNTLPEHMIPARFTVLESLPLTHNGKVDRQALLRGKETERQTPYKAPSSEMERTLCTIWQQVLGQTRVGVDEDFFESGGNSIMAMQIMALALQKGIMLNPGLLFAQRTVAKLAASLDAGNVSVHSTASSEETRKQHVLVPMNDSRSPRNVFALHPYGGAVACYGTLADSLKDTARFYGLQAPDLHTDYKTESVEALVEYYVSLILETQPLDENRPYYLIGWSSGGILAYEVACQLSCQGGEIGYLGNFDSLPVHPDLNDHFGVSDTQKWYDKIYAFYAGQIDLDWTKLDSLSEIQGRQLILQTIEEQNLIPTGMAMQTVENNLDFLVNFARAMQHYRSPQSSLDMELFIADSVEKPNKIITQPGKGQYYWDKITSGEINVQYLNCDHKLILESPNVEALGALLTQRMTDNAKDTVTARGRS